MNDPIIKQCNHLPPVSSLKHLFEITRIQCSWFEIASFEYKETSIKKQDKLISLKCIKINNRIVLEDDELREYFGIEENRFKIKGNKIKNGIVLIRSSFPGSFCKNFKECSCFVLRQLDQEKYRNLLWVEKLLFINTEDSIKKKKEQLLLNSDNLLLNPYILPSLNPSTNQIIHDDTNISPIQSKNNTYNNNTQPSQNYKHTSIAPLPLNHSSINHSSLNHSSRTFTPIFHSKVDINIPTNLIKNSKIPGYVNKRPDSFELTPERKKQRLI